MNRNAFQDSSTTWSESYCTLFEQQITEICGDPLRELLWNLLPKAANELTELEPFKVALGAFLKTFPDTPPTKVYTTANNNSVLEWSLQRGSTVRGVDGVRA